MMFHCCELRRLEVLRRSGSKNAIEFLEVLDHGAPPGVPPATRCHRRPSLTWSTDSTSCRGHW
jgi:hypothetical protein